MAELTCETRSQNSTVGQPVHGSGETVSPANAMLEVTMEWKLVDPFLEAPNLAASLLSQPYSQPSQVSTGSVPSRARTHGRGEWFWTVVDLGCISKRRALQRVATLLGRRIIMLLHDWFTLLAAAGL